MSQTPAPHKLFYVQELQSQAMGRLLEAMEVAHCCYLGGESVPRESVDYPTIFKVIEGITKDAFDKLDEMSVVINQLREGQ